MIDFQSREPVNVNGGCHCGAVKFRATLTRGWASARRCNCSICRMRGAVALTSSPGAFELRRGADRLAVYQFNTRTAQHYFCSICGIYTHHRRRSNPSELGINAACIEGVSPFDFSEITVNDGVHHLADDPQRQGRVAGTLRFEPADS